MANQILRSFPAAADPTTWVHRVVYKSADNAVSLNNAGTQLPIGVVQRATTDGTTHSVQVCVSGPCWVVAGETTLNAADSAFFRGGDDTGGAALDGRAVVAAAGEYYVGRLTNTLDITAGGLCQCIVSPGQMAQAGS